MQVKFIVITFTLLLTTTVFGAKISSKFNKTNLEMMALILNTIEPDENPFKGIDEVEFKSSKPDTIKVIVQYVGKLDEDSKLKIEKGYKEEINDTAKLMDVTGQKVLFVYKKAK